MEFSNNNTKPPVARKLAVGHLCVGQLVVGHLCVQQLVFWLLVASSFNHFKMHAWWHAVVAAFRIYAQHGDVAAIRGGWSLCIK